MSPTPSFTAALCLLATAATLHAAPARPGQRLPNVVFILADDGGWADPGRYHQLATGTPPAVATPNLNRLADQGMMFTDAHLHHALCAPNRFALLTGSYSHRSRPWGTWNRTASTAFHFASQFIEDHLQNHPDKPFMVYYKCPSKASNPAPPGDSKNPATPPDHGHPANPSPVAQVGRSSAPWRIPGASSGSRDRHASIGSSCLHSDRLPQITTH
jgi:hypothetical protein